MEWGGTSRTARIAALAAMCLVTTLFLLPISINVSTGGTPPEFLRPYTGWLWPSFGLLSAAVIVLAVWERLRGHETSSRAAALDRIENRARGLLGGSLGAQARIKLGLARQPRLVVRPGDDEALESSDLEAACSESTLLLGEPGSGRTTLLLDLCLTLVGRARSDPERPVPVVVDLANWSAYGPRGMTDFGHWLLRELRKRYGISRSACWHWLTRRRLTLLIDGLDDVPAVDRARCVEDITSFTERFAVPQTAICGGQPRGVQSFGSQFEPVHIQPLARGQVLEYIAAVSPRLDGLQSALERDPALWEMLRTPLMLNLVSLTYRDREAKEPAREQRELLDAYLVERLAGQRAAGRTIRALKFLARVAGNGLTARVRLPARKSWIGFLPQSPIWLLFMRALPAALAGATAAVCAVIGLRFGLLTALVAAAAFTGLAVWLNHVPLAFRRPSGAHGVAVAAVGTVAGIAFGAAIAGIGVWLGSRSWPAYIAFGVVVLVTFLLAMLMVEGSAPVPWALLITAVPAITMIWTGPSSELLTGIGIGFTTGVAGGLAAAATARVWSSLHAEQRRRVRPTGAWWLRVGLPLVASAGLLGTGVAAAAGAPLNPAIAAPVVGLLIGLQIAPTAARDYVVPFDVMSLGLAELLARPLVLGELSLRRKALLHVARDRLLLTHVDGEYRFVHAVLRDHLATCDPVALENAVRLRAGA